MPEGREEELPIAIARVKGLREENKMLRVEIRRLKSRYATSALLLLPDTNDIVADSAMNSSRAEQWVNKSQWRESSIGVPTVS